MPKRAGRTPVDTFISGLGTQLAQARRERRLSQRDLAATSGVAQADISRIERGLVSPTTATLGKLLQAMGARVRLVPDRAPAGSRYEDQRPYVVADQLDDLHGPTRGTVQLDGRLNWSGHGVYDLAERRRLISMYETVIREASHPEELDCWLDGETLIRLWPDLVLPGRARQLWETRFPALATQRRLVA